MAKRGLGRGFDSLIPAELLDESFDPTADQDDRISDLRQIKLAEIMPDPTQPRRVFDEVLLDELAESIRVHGVLQPIVVTPDNKGNYVIVAGERRYRAATKAGLEKIPARCLISTSSSFLLSKISNAKTSTPSKPPRHTSSCAINSTLRSSKSASASVASHPVQ